MGPIKNNKGTDTRKKSRNNRAVNDCQVHWVLGSHCFIIDAFTIADYTAPNDQKKIVVRDGVAFCKKQSLPYSKVLYHPTPAACEEIKRISTEGKERRQLWKASFVLRTEFGTTEFEAEVLTTTQPRL
jgi:hypothetical protein